MFPADRCMCCAEYSIIDNDLHAECILCTQTWQWLVLHRCLIREVHLSQFFERTRHFDLKTSNVKSSFRYMLPVSHRSNRCVFVMLQNKEINWIDYENNVPRMLQRFASECNPRTLCCIPASSRVCNCVRCRFVDRIRTNIESHRSIRTASSIFDRTAMRPSQHAVSIHRPSFRAKKANWVQFDHIIPAEQCIDSVWFRAVFSNFCTSLIGRYARPS